MQICYTDGSQGLPDGWTGYQGFFSEITNKEYSKCTKCFGGGVKHRRADILLNSANADSGIGNLMQTLECNTIEEYGMMINIKIELT